MTDGDWTNETGEGVKSLAGVNGDVGRIYIDLGALYPVMIVALLNLHRESGDGNIQAIIEISPDGSTYYGSGPLSISGVTGDTYRAMDPFFAYTRYFRIRFYTASVTVNPSVFHVKGAELMALQLM